MANRRNRRRNLRRRSVPSPVTLARLSRFRRAYPRWLWPVPTSPWHAFRQTTRWLNQRVELIKSELVKKRRQHRHQWQDSAPGNFAIDILEPRVLLSTTNLSGVDDLRGQFSQQVHATSLQPKPDSYEQIIYLDFDGEKQVSYDGPVLVENFDVPAFSLDSVGLAGDESRIVDEIISDLNTQLATLSVSFTASEPASGPYSTVFVGGDSNEFHEFGIFYGLAESIDVGNQDRTDNAFVFADHILEVSDKQTIVPNLSLVIGHEVQHLIGFEHDIHRAETQHNGLLDAYAFKPYTHVQIGNDAIADLNSSSNEIEINGEYYPVDSRVVSALNNYPEYYNAGVVGPDGFPDLLMGQGVIHPADTGKWLAQIYQSAWQAQTDSRYSSTEKGQILAWSYGFMTHAAGDVFSHSLVNEFSGGAFPDVPDIVLEVAGGIFAENELASAENAVRHLLIEEYIADATPGFDGNSGRDTYIDINTNQTASNELGAIDYSSDSTPEIPFAAPPAQFIYETLLAKDIGGDPSALRSEKPFEIVGSPVSLTSILSNLDSNDTNYVSGDTLLVTGTNPDGSTFSFTVAINEITSIGDVIGEVNSNAVAATAFLDSDGYIRFAADTPGNGTVALAIADSTGNTGATAFREHRFIKDGQLSNSRGPIVDLFLTLKNYLIENREEILLPNFYIDNWIEDIDSGLEHWGELGLAITQALFDPQVKRDLQNEVATFEGDRTEQHPDRIEAENNVGMLDVVLHTTTDFRQDYLYSMLGLPDFVGTTESLLDSFSDVLRSILGPLGLSNPLDEIADSVQEWAKDVIKAQIREKFGIDVDLYAALISHPSNLLGLESIQIGASTLEVFQAGDREKLDGYLGLGPNDHLPLTVPDLPVDAVSFHQNAVGRLKDNVSFDKTEFAAYADSVMLAKLLLLDGNGLSQVMTDLVGSNYDYMLMQPNVSDALETALQFNIMLATLPNVTDLSPIRNEAGPLSTQDLQSQWLYSIDTDSPWRRDNQPRLYQDPSADIKPGPTGTGAFPLWESCLLRDTAFRVLFNDWLPSGEFPDFGDMTSHDPNVDNITDVCGHTGDIVSINLKKVFSTDADFHVVGFDLLGEGVQQLNVEQVERGDLTLSYAGEPVSYVVFSECAEQLHDDSEPPASPFFNTGRLYLSSPTDNQLPYDVDPLSTGFQGAVRLLYRVGPMRASVSVSEFKDQLINGQFSTALMDQLSNQGVFLSSNTLVNTRDIGNGEIHWLLIDSDSGQQFAVVEEMSSLNVYLSRTTLLRIGSGFSSDLADLVRPVEYRIDAMRQQQRLRYLGYRDYDGERLVVDGIVGTRTEHVTGLFNAAIADANHSSQPAVDLTYINSKQAPSWKQLSTFGIGYVDTTAGQNWATNWALEIIEAAGLKLAGGPTLQVDQLSLVSGGPISNFVNHQSGRDIDILAAASEVDAGNWDHPYYRTHEVNSQTYVAAITDADATGDNHIIRVLQGMTAIEQQQTGGNTIVHLSGTPFLAELLTYSTSAWLWLDASSGPIIAKIISVDDGADTVTVEGIVNLPAGGVASAVYYAGDKNSAPSYGNALLHSASNANDQELLRGITHLITDNTVSGYSFANIKTQLLAFTNLQTPSRATVGTITYNDPLRMDHRR